jgi:hypothetical protein
MMIYLNRCRKEYHYEDGCTVRVGVETLEECADNERKIAEIYCRAYQDRDPDIVYYLSDRPTKAWKSKFHAVPECPDCGVVFEEGTRRLCLPCKAEQQKLRWYEKKSTAELVASMARHRRNAERIELFLLSRGE